MRFHHAPAWGRDTCASTIASFPCRFQSRRTAWGGDGRESVRQLPGEFQSTRPRGRDTGLNWVYPKTKFQSTARWGGTGGTARPETGEPFQSTAREGADQKLIGGLYNQAVQSTRPAVARVTVWLWSRSWSGFQSAPAWGATVTLTDNDTPDGVSIHAPAWGATGEQWTFSVRWRSFNPRARVGRDSRGIISRPTSSRFNPRARVGRDFAPSHSFCHQSSFQSTRPRGARRVSGVEFPSARSFNPRARVGRDSARV